VSILGYVGTLAVAYVAGLGSAVVKHRYDREADVRKHGLEAVEDVAVRCDDWFEAVRAAIGARRDDFTGLGGSDDAFDNAELALAGARRGVNRVHALLPKNSKAALHAYGMMAALSASLDALREWPPEPDEVDDPSELAEEWSGDEEDYHPVYTPFFEELDEAAMWHRLGLQSFGHFIQVVPDELRTGPVHRAARVARGAPGSGWRRIRRAVRRPLAARRSRRELARIAARAPAATEREVDR
jgi:hypothetical protein